MKWSAQSQFEFACTLGIILIGLLASVALWRTLRGAAVGIAGLFVLAADGELFYARLCIWGILKQAGCWPRLDESRVFLTLWYYTFELSPVVLAAFFAWVLWLGIRKLPKAPEGKQA